MHNHQHHDHRGKRHNLLTFAIVVIFLFAIIELIGGWLSGSLALLSDAGHMASDGLSLILTAFAVWLSKKPPSLQHSYGLGRSEIVAAWISSLLMLLISIMVIAEAIKRFNHPTAIHFQTIVIIASLGLIINVVVAYLLSRDEQTLNIRAALLHVFSDMLGSIAALIAGVVIWYSGWTPIDPILSIVIGILIIIASLRLLRESLFVLMEAVPSHLNLTSVNTDMLQIEGVKNIHDLHIWTIFSGTIALSAHVNIHELSAWPTVLSLLKHRLHEKI